MKFFVRFTAERKLDDMPQSRLFAVRSIGGSISYSGTVSAEDPDEAFFRIAKYYSRANVTRCYPTDVEATEPKPRKRLINRNERSNRAMRLAESINAASNALACEGRHNALPAMRVLCARRAKELDRRVVGLAGFASKTEAA